MTEFTVSAQLRASDGSTTAYMYDRDTGHVMVMESGSVDNLSGSEQSVTRGWIVPEQPQGDFVFRECWLQLLYPEDWQHGLTVTVLFDYSDSNSVTRSWTASELETLSVNGRVTVGVNCHAKQARAVKLVVSDVISDGATNHMQPLHATITFGASDGPRRRTLKAGALK